MINFAKLLYMMSDQDISIDTIGLKTTDVEVAKKVYGLKTIKKIVTKFEENSRLPVCSECSSSSHRTEDCPLLAAKEKPENDDEDDDNISITDIFSKPIPQKKKTEKEDPPKKTEKEDHPDSDMEEKPENKQKEAHIDSDDDNSSTDSISIAEADFSSTRDKYKTTAKATSKPNSSSSKKKEKKEDWEI
jgi:hypothetical protein